MAKTPKPDWLKIRVSAHEERNTMFQMLEGLSLHTVCEEANCPNLSECFGRKTATFMILGKNCTRNCTFCNITHHQTDAVDFGEPDRVAAAVKQLGLRHVVITSVTRDDLQDGGAGMFASTILAIRKENPNTSIEVLVPDFQGDATALQIVLAAKPDILAHNLETVPSLYSAVRPMAIYVRSIELLKRAALVRDIRVKSGIMLGVGETKEQVLAVMDDLLKAGCRFLSIGQYLSPSDAHYPVLSYVTPDEFSEYQKTGRLMGFAHVSSGPLVRSSYHADEAMLSE